MPTLEYSNNDMGKIQVGKYDGGRRLFQRMDLGTFSAATCAALRSGKKQFKVR